jgi:DNA-directed RNA polymerase specialized sigma24 family protein
MSKVIRPTFAALLGAAALLATAAPAAAEDRAHPVHEAQVAQLKTLAEPACTSAAATVCDAAAPASLRSIIEERAEKAERAGRYDDVDELTTLWLTLERRQQLDRIVDRGEQFVNVSLRNQKRSEQRAQSRALRRSGPDLTDVETPAFTMDVGQALDAEAFIASLEEPYRSAVRFSLSGMNHREVAEQMGASHAAVRKWAQRLRDRLVDEGWELAAQA